MVLNLLKGLFGGGDRAAAKGSDTAKFADFAEDLGMTTEGTEDDYESVEALEDSDVLALVDWADASEDVLGNLSALFVGDRALSPDDMETVIAAGDKAGEKGRGHSALPTIDALDEVLNGIGDRLLWVDTGGDCYDIARVSDAIWAKWHDVSFGDLSVLEARMKNEFPRKRILAKAPR